MWKGCQRIEPHAEQQGARLTNELPGRLTLRPRAPESSLGDPARHTSSPARPNGLTPIHLLSRADIMATLGPNRHGMSLLFFLIDTKFKFFNQINDKPEFAAFLNDLLFDRYAERKSVAEE